MPTSKVSELRGDLQSWKSIAKAVNISYPCNQRMIRDSDVHARGVFHDPKHSKSSFQYRESCVESSLPVLPASLLQLWLLFYGLRLLSGNFMASSLQFHPCSLGSDGRGRLFIGEGCLIRAIRKGAARDIRDFLSLPETHELIREGAIISAQIEPGGTDDYPLLLRHEKIPRLSIPAEWSMEMLREAALFGLRMAERLASYGYLLDDLRPSNIGFVGARPILLDYGCVVRASEVQGRRQFLTQSSVTTFVQTFVEPLRLMSFGHEPVARAMMLKDVRFRYPNVLPLTLRDLVHRRIMRMVSASGLAPTIGRLRRTICRPRRTGRGISDLSSWVRKMEHAVRLLPQGTLTSRWQHYHPEGSFCTNSKGAGVLETKRHCVEEILAPIRYQSVTDLGCSRGFFAYHFAKQGIPVVALDSDEWCINDLFCRARNERLPISTVLMSLRAPTPTPPLGCLEEMSVSNRFASELVLALALIHHFVAFGRCDFETFTQILLLFTRKYALVEFVTRDDKVLSKADLAIAPWYGADAFEQALRPHFSILAIHAGATPTRNLYLLERTR